MTSTVCRYKGTEPSPKGMGVCAHLMQVGDRRQGLDGYVWFVAVDVNGRKHWKRERSGVKANAASRMAPARPQKSSSCRPDQIVNPATGRCVSKYGKIGQQLLQMRAPGQAKPRRGRSAPPPKKTTKRKAYAPELWELPYHGPRPTFHEKRMADIEQLRGLFPHIPPHELQTLRAF